MIKHKFLYETKRFIFKLYDVSENFLLSHKKFFFVLMLGKE